MNTTENIPPDVTEKAREVWFKAIGSDSNAAGIDIIAKALLIERMQAYKKGWTEALDEMEAWNATNGLTMPSKEGIVKG